MSGGATGILGLRIDGTCISGSEGTLQVYRGAYVWAWSLAEVVTKSGTSLPAPAPGCPTNLQPPRRKCGRSTEAEDIVSGRGPFLPAP